MINANFKFHPVGQGCFYSGRIKYDRVSFNIVYDCGTVSPRNFLTGEINKYKRTINGVLDLLIISHFDKDHINGVFELLNGITCKNLIIPYYQPIERLMLAISANENDNADNRDYIEFLRNPIAYFIERDFNIERIIFIGEPNNDSDTVYNPDNNSPDFDINGDTSMNIQVDLFENNIFPENVADLDKAATLQNTIVKFLKKPYRIQLPFWEFVFYLKEQENKLLVTKITTEINNLAESLNVSVLDLFDEEHLKDLKKIYASKFKNLNNTSVVTYHGPINSFNIKGELWRSFYWSCYKGKCGTLLTGDISLKAIKNIQSLQKYYGSYLDTISFFQIPHHGAKANWNITPSNNLREFCTYIINHGLGRKHHPSLEVIHFVKSTYNNSIISFSNEAQASEYYVYGYFEKLIEES